MRGSKRGDQGYLQAGGLSKLVISRVIIRVTPFRALITLLITYVLRPLPLQVGPPQNYVYTHIQRSLGCQACLGSPLATYRGTFLFLQERQGQKGTAGEPGIKHIPTV